jgi:hypothetical protein
MIEKLHEQFAARPRRMVKHLLKGLAKAVPNVGAARPAYLIFRLSVVGGTDMRRTQSIRKRKNTEPQVLISTTTAPLFGK